MTDALFTAPAADALVAAVQALPNETTSWSATGIGRTSLAVAFASLAKGGHLRYVLAITVNVDGYMTLLDPLVVDADGEWEAWDYGTKLPGAVRHASFGALLEADTRRSRM